MGFAILVGLFAGFAALVVIALIKVVRRRVRPFDFVEGAWGDDGFWGEEALVPVGPPRKPLSEAAVALPLPGPEPEGVEAYGREAREGESTPDALAS